MCPSSIGCDILRRKHYLVRPSLICGYLEQGHYRSIVDSSNCSNAFQSRILELHVVELVELWNK